MYLSVAPKHAPNVFMYGWSIKINLETDTYFP